MCTEKEVTPTTPTNGEDTTTADHGIHFRVDAEQRLANFEASRKHYYAIKSQLFGPPDLETRRTYVARKTKLGKIIKRIFEAIEDSAEISDETEDLKQATISVVVLERDALLTDDTLKPLLGIKENMKPLQAFMEQELYKEVNCERFLIIKGLTSAQFHCLLSKMGFNPWTFFSDPRGENGGSATIDNELLEDGKHPLADLRRDDADYAREMILWQPVFPKLAHIPWISTWRMSRTHGVVYALKDEKGKDVLMFPVHIDPKNPIVTVRDIFEREKVGKQALAYHQIAEESGSSESKYVGTGLYDLGCKNFIRLLRQAHAHGLFAHLVIDGYDKLQTTNTIVGDDRITWQIAEKVQQTGKG